MIKQICLSHLLLHLNIYYYKGNNMAKKTKKTIDIFSEISPYIPECEIEPGIVKLVGILNSKGLATYMSCQGHGQLGKGRAWVDIDAAHLKGYVKKHHSKFEQFLKAGEGRWYLRVEYFGKNYFKGMGKPQPRFKSMKRHVEVEMSVRIILNTTAFDSTGSQKTKEMKALERAAQKYL